MTGGLRVGRSVLAQLQSFLSRQRSGRGSGADFGRDSARDALLVTQSLICGPTETEVAMPERPTPPELSNTTSVNQGAESTSGSNSAYNRGR